MHPQHDQKFAEIQKALHLQHYPSPLKQYTINEVSFMVKHDDQLELGCSKQRSLTYMIYQYLQNGEHYFTVSSSGNAALVSAYTLLQFPDTTLRIFLSNQVSDYKLNQFLITFKIPSSVKQLRENFRYKNIEFILSDNPKQQAFQLGNQGWINLRGSQDDSALIGFHTIAYELLNQSPNIDAIFVPASSGTTALGIYHGFREMERIPAMHIVQTTKVNALVNKLIRDNEGNRLPIEHDHPSESIVDSIGHRRKQIEEAIIESNGNGWCISKSEVEEAHQILLDHNLIASYDSALTYAAFLKVQHIKRYKYPVLVFTG